MAGIPYPVIDSEKILRELDIYYYLYCEEECQIEAFPRTLRGFTSETYERYRLGRAKLRHT